MNPHDDDLEAMLLERAERSASVHAPTLEATLRAAVPRGAEARETARLRRGFLVAAAAAVVVGALLIGPLSPLPATNPPPATSAPPSSGPSQLPPALTSVPDVALTAPPHTTGTCPVTPFTDLAAGTAPEVVTSDLRWRWGGGEWRAGAPEKLVLISPQAESGSAQIVAVRLDFPAGAAAPRDSAQYPVGDGGPTWVAEISIPQPGCWLLTAVTPDAHGSVVVVVGTSGPSATATAGAEAPVRPTARPRPVAACPSSVQEAGATVRTWLDGNVRWQDPDPRAWAAGKDRKLVVFGVRAPAPDEIAVLVRLVEISSPTLVAEPPVVSEPATGSPPAFGFTLPSNGCWAIAYVNPLNTSTIVVPVGLP